VRGGSFGWTRRLVNGDNSGVVTRNVVVQSAGGLKFKEGLGEASVLPEDLLDGANICDAMER
jgi:hypothetical protein